MGKGIALCVMLLSVLLATAQRGQVNAIVVNESGQPLESATVEMISSKDSALIKTGITDKTGLAEIPALRIGDFILRVSLVNYTTCYSSVFNLHNLQSVITLPKLIMQPRVAQLGAVTVTARKPFIQKLSDRIVVNVENSIVSAGSSAMDVMERAPGVNIDQNDVISLRGRAGVIIMIDGKPSAMTGADLANYLRSLPAAALERIDIITNPSSKYDAAGNSGMIDIRMKKDQRLGMNGTWNAGYGQGVYPKVNAGTTFNYRNRRINLFGNYNYNHRVWFNRLVLDRSFFNDGNYNGGDLKDNYSKSPVRDHSGRIGLDFFPSSKTIVGVVLHGNFNHFGRDADVKANVIDPQRQKTSSFGSQATNDDNRRNIFANINFKHSFDSVGKELTADIDYGSYYTNSFSVNATRYYKLDGTPLQPDYILQGHQKGQLNFTTGKLDYVHPLSKAARWETGFKTSFLSSDNDARFDDMSSGTPQNDVNKTNHFIYKEHNNAGYINFKKDFKKFDIQLGLRGEHTALRTEQMMGNIRFDSSYFQLFPSVFINYKLTEDQTIGVSVSRRIDRPGYAQLNPFLYLIDITTYATGRPGLLPQFTWSYEMSYTIKNIHLTLGYSHTTDNQDIVIARFRDVFPSIPGGDNVTVQIPINLSSSDYYGLTISAPVRISKRWNMINNGNVFFNKFNGRLCTTVLDRGKPALDLRTDHTFTFNKGWTAELNANYNSGGQEGFMVYRPRWGIAAGVQKAVLKGKGTIRFNITDIFWSNLPRATITYDNYIEKWRAHRETRVANLSFTYRFGNNKVQAARRRATASEEERQRAGN